MSSGPSYILVLSQIEGTANIISAWREFIGPADIEEARREKPERLVERNSKCCTFEEKEQRTKQLNLRFGEKYHACIYFCTVDQHTWKGSQFWVWSRERTAHSRLLDQTHPNIMLLFG